MGEAGTVAGLAYLPSMATPKFQWTAESGLARDELPPPPDRGQRKREAAEANELIDELLRLPAAELASMPLAGETLAALELLRDLQGRGGVRNGLRRQRLAVGGCLRREDVTEVRRLLETPRGATPREAMLQTAERWRGRMLAEGDEALAEFLDAHETADRQRLRQLVRQARKDAAREAGKPGGPKRAFKELFGVIREALEAG